MEKLIKNDIDIKGLCSRWFVHSDLSKQEKQDFTHQHMVLILFRKVRIDCDIKMLETMKVDVFLNLLFFFFTWSWQVFYVALATGCSLR